MTDNEEERPLQAPPPMPAFAGPAELSVASLRDSVTQAVAAWLLRTPSSATRKNYRRDLDQFFKFAGIPRGRPEQLLDIRPEDVAAWREHLQGQDLANTTVARKLTVLRSLFSYLQVYGYTGANPAHSKFVATPPVPRDGKTVGMSPKDCRRLLDAPDPSTPVGLRDRAILATLAYSACRVGDVSAQTARRKRQETGTAHQDRLASRMAIPFAVPIGLKSSLRLPKTQVSLSRAHARARYSRSTRTAPALISLSRAYARTR
jgi:hypothetical protein